MILNRIKKYFFQKKNINVGENTRILTSINNFGSEPFLVEIGNDCVVTSGVKFITHDASIEIALRYKGKKRVVDNMKYELMKKIIVNNNCMIGVNSIIMPGVTIGPNSIIGSGSVVTKDVDEGYVYAGNPAKKICSIDEYYEKIKDDIFYVKKAKDLNQRKQNIIKAMKNNEEK